MGKFTKRLKKLAKKVAPIAALGLGAAALGRKKGVAFGRPKRGSFDQMAADAAMPDHLSRTMGMRGRDSVLASPRWSNWDADYMPLKKGGRVKGVGKAKRGFGRALKKGK